MTPFPPLELPGRKADRIPVVLVVLVLGVVLVSCGVAIQKSLTGMAVLEANFRRTPLSCLNELRLTSSLNEAQDNLP